MFIPAKPLHNETQRHVARMSVRNDDHISHLDTLIRGLVDQGLWDLLTVCCVAGPNASDSLLDLKGNTDSVLVGSPAFVADKGFTTVGVSALVNTQLTMDGAYDSNNMISVYIQNASAGGASCFIGELYTDGVAATHNVALIDNTTLLSFWLQSTIISPALGVSGGGFRAGSRVDSSNALGCGDLSVLSVVSSAATWGGGTHYPLVVGARNDRGTYDVPSANQYSHWSVGFGFSQDQLLAYNTLIKAYFTQRGTAV